MSSMRREVEEALKRTNEMMKQKFNKNKEPEQQLDIGDLVWIDGTHYNMGQASRKLAFKWVGPFPIVRRVSEVAYELRITEGWKHIHLVINETHLKSYVQPTFEQQQKRFNSLIIPIAGEEKLLEVKEILDSCWRNDLLQYLVKWRGQPWEERTWEWWNNILKGAQQLCDKFHKEHPDVPRVPTIWVPGRLHSDITKTWSWAGGNVMIQPPTYCALITCCLVSLVLISQYTVA